jgi:hypothetical protein
MRRKANGFNQDSTKPDSKRVPSVYKALPLHQMSLHPFISLEIITHYIYFFFPNYQAMKLKAAADIFVSHGRARVKCFLKFQVNVSCVRGIDVLFIFH